MVNEFTLQTCKTPPGWQIFKAAMSNRRIIMNLMIHAVAALCCGLLLTSAQQQEAMQGGKGSVNMTPHVNELFEHSKPYFFRMAKHDIHRGPPPASTSSPRFSKPYNICTSDWMPFVSNYDRTCFLPLKCMSRAAFNGNVWHWMGCVHLCL
jgi:hypothetical protein